MNATETIAESVRRALPNVKRGTLRFWGAWFGRPYDRLHTLLSCEAKENVLRLYFDQGEVVSVWLPQGFSMDESTFLIASAERVQLEWFYDGLPEIDGNLFFKDFVKTGETVVANTNVNWHTPDLSTDLSLPAVEIVSLLGTEGALVPEVDPADLLSVWKVGQDNAIEGQQVAVGVDLYEDVCSPGANVYAVWYRASMLGLMADPFQLLAPWIHDGKIDYAVFRVMAAFPVKRIGSGAHDGLPFDVEEYLKQVENQAGSPH